MAVKVQIAIRIGDEIDDFASQCPKAEFPKEEILHYEN